MSRSSLVGVAVLLVLLLATPVAAASAETISISSIDLDYSDAIEKYSVSEASASWTTGGSPVSTVTVYPGIRFNNIERYPNLNYVSISTDSNICWFPESGSGVPFQYTIPGDSVKKIGTVYVSKQRNLAGGITGTYMTFTFPDWKIGSMTGQHTIPIYLGDGSSISIGGHYTTGTPATAGIVSLTSTSGDYTVIQGSSQYAFSHKISTTVVGYDDFKNTISLRQAGNAINVVLDRYFSDRLYNSQINIYSSDGVLIYDNLGSNSSFMSFPISKYLHIDIKMLNGDILKTYIYSGTGGETSKFSISLSDTGSVGSPITATLIPASDAPRYSEIAWTISDPDGNVDVELYTKSSDDWTTWTHYNKTSRRLDPSSEAAAHSLQFTPSSAGTWTVSAVVRDQQPPSSGAALAEVSAACEVERTAGNVDVVISIFDGAKSSASYLAGVGVVVRDLTRNGTVIYDSTGEYIPGASGTTNGRATLTAPLGDQIQITAKKTGYLTATITNFVQPTALPLNQMPIAITLMPSAPPAPDKAWVTFHVTDLRSQPIEGAAVQVSDQTGITSSLGSCRIAVSTNQTLPYSVTKNGYYSASGYIMGVTENSQITVELYSSAPVTPTVTPTPGSSGPGSGTYAPGDESQIVGDGLSIFFQYYQLIAVLCFLCLITGLTNLMGGKRR